MFKDVLKTMFSAVKDAAKKTCEEAIHQTLYGEPKEKPKVIGFGGGEYVPFVIGKCVGLRRR